jgi:hypothetical protein
MMAGSIGVLILAIASAVYTIVISNPSAKDYDRDKKRLGVVVTVFLWVVFALMQAFPGVVGTSYN